jgi:nitrogen fixation protein FixH
MTGAIRRGGFRIRGWHVLVAFVLFFAIDIAINAVFMVQAYKTFPGETSVTPYEDGLIYNTTLARHRAQAALGWRIAAGPDGQGALRVEVRDRTGAPIRGLRVTALLRRPATETGAHSDRFEETAPGVYLARDGALGGAWDLDVTARDAQGREAAGERRIVTP